MACHFFCLQNIKISFEYVDFYAKIYQFLYPTFGNSTSEFTIIKGPGGAKFYCGQWDQPGKIREMGPWGKDKTIQLSFKSNNDKYRNKGALVYLYAETIEGKKTC